MTTQENYNIVAAQPCRAESGEWLNADGQYISDMLNYNEVEKEHNYHDGLAIRTKVDSVIGTHSPELATSGSEKPDIKVEDGKCSVEKSMAFHIPTVEDEYTNHAETLRNALHATAILEVETQKAEIEQADRNTSYHATKKTPSLTSPPPSNSYCDKIHYTPKTPFDAATYLQKIKTRFSTHPGIFTSFISILKAHQAAPPPSPTRETHDAVKKLFWPHVDLIRGFGEWLPRPVGREGVEMGLRGEMQKCGDGVSAGTDTRIMEIEKEITGLKAAVTILIVEYRGLRERVRRMDGDTAGPWWVVERLERKVEGLEGEMEIMRMEVEGLVD